jgi:tetratricopeptide (TPR) repeat protein
MSLGAGRHRVVAGELVEWWEDLAGAEIGSQVVLVAVPPGWGRSAVLREFAAAAGGDDGPVTLVTEIPGGLPPGRAVQADALRDELAAATDPDHGPLAQRVAEAFRLLELDRAPGRVQLGLGLVGLRVAGPWGAASLLVASLAVTAAGNAWDGSPAGEAGGVARAARGLARVSVAVPVVVVIDDADCLDVDLAVALIRGLAGRLDGHVLVVAAAAPDSDLVSVLADEPGLDLAGRVHRAEADPSMDYAARVQLAVELLPGLPAAGVERIARRTVTFAEVFAVAAAGRLAELGPGTEAGEAVSAVDAVAEGVLERARPSAEAVVLAWAGGALHTGQARMALQILGAESQDDDPRVIRAGALVRLAGPTDMRVTGSVAALSMADRRELAAAVLDEAVRLASDPAAGLVERVAARQAAHHVRGDLADRGELAGVQVGLIRGLETLGDPAAARDVATAALADLDALPPAARDAGQRQELLMAALRLARTQPATSQDEDLIVAEAVELALSGGAAVRPEARVWAAVDLLHRPGHRQDGLRLARQVTGELETRGIHSELAAQWRLLLAFHAGQAGDTALAQRLLATMINTGPAAQRDAAAAVLRAIDDPHADTRLQIILLNDELTRTPAGTDDDLLRLHHALADNYAALGDYRQALHHGNQELPLRRRIQGPDHPETLTIRGDIAFRTGECGDAAGALRLLQELLPDQVRVQGPGHPDTLRTRADIAFWTGECGDAAGALRLYQDLLPEVVRVLGPGHRDTLATRNNIAHWTGDCGDAAGALRLSQDLLPDRIRVLGPDHRDTLHSRINIAGWTRECGDAAGALRLYQDLLRDLVRVLGPGHPDTLTTRNNIAAVTGE